MVFHGLNLHFPYHGKPVIVFEAKNSVSLPLPHTLGGGGGSMGTGEEPRW